MTSSHLLFPFPPFLLPLSSISFFNILILSSTSLPPLSSKTTRASPIYFLSCRSQTGASQQLLVQSYAIDEVFSVTATKESDLPLSASRGCVRGCQWWLCVCACKDVVQVRICSSMHSVRKHTCGFWLTGTKLVLTQGNIYRVFTSKEFYYLWLAIKTRWQREWYRNAIYVGINLGDCLHVCFYLCKYLGSRHEATILNTPLQHYWMDWLLSLISTTLGTSSRSNG